MAGLAAALNPTQPNHQKAERLGLMRAGAAGPSGVCERGETNAESRKHFLGLKNIVPTRTLGLDRTDSLA